MSTLCTFNHRRYHDNRGRVDGVQILHGLHSLRVKVQDDDDLFCPMGTENQ